MLNKLIDNTFIQRSGHRISISLQDLLVEGNTVMRIPSSGELQAVKAITLTMAADANTDQPMIVSGVVLSGCFEPSKFIFVLAIDILKP